MNGLVVIGDTHFGDFDTSRQDAILADIENFPSVSTPIIHMGDLTEDGLVAEDAAALAWLDQLPREWLACIGNHDILTPRSYAQAAAAFGMELEFTRDVGFAKLIFTYGASMGATRRAWLDSELGSTTQPCIIFCHYPLQTTVLGGGSQFQSIDTGFYMTDSADIRTILGNHSNAIAWVSGHTHTILSEATLVTQETLGSHTVAMINTSAPVYQGRDGRQPEDACPVVFLELESDRINITARDALEGDYVSFGGALERTVEFGQTFSEGTGQAPATGAIPLFDANGATNENLEIYVGDDLQPRLRFGTGSSEFILTGPSPLVEGEWAHVAARCSTDGVDLLLDGEVVASTTTLPDITAGSDLYIGSLSDGTLHANAPIDDVRISNVARSDAEMAATASSASPADADDSTRYKLTLDSALTHEGILVVDSPLPTISITFTPAGAEAQEWVHVIIERKVDEVWWEHWEYPQQVSSDTSFTPPDDSALAYGETYRIVARVGDDVERADLAGDRSFLEVTSDEFTVAEPVAT